MSFEEVSALPPRQQQVLYCCAFWVMSADEELQAGEQTWLAAQFGEHNANQLLEDCLALSGEEFLATFDDLVAGLTDADRQTLYPHVPAWLSACAAADGQPGNEEREIVGHLLQRLGIEPHIEPSTPAEPAPTTAPEPADAAAVPEGPALLSGHTGSITSLACSADGRLAWSASRDGTVRRWILETAREDACLHVSERGVAAIAIAGESTILALDRTGRLSRWRPDSPEPAWQVMLDGSPCSLVIDPSGARAAVTLLRGAVVLVDAHNGTTIGTFTASKPSAMRAAAYSPDGALLAGGGDGKVVTLWDTETGSVRATLEGHEAMVTSVSFDAASARVLSASRDNTIRMWDTASQSLLRIYEGHDFSVHDVAISDDGARVASASGDHTIRVWDAERGNTLARYEDVSAGFTRVAFIPGTHRLLCGGASQVVFLLDEQG